MYLIVAAIALLVAATSLWGSVATVRLSRIPGAYTDKVATWAYFQFVLCVVFGASTMVAGLKALRPENKAVIVLSGLVAALATLVSILGVLMGIASLSGHDFPQGLAVPVLLAATAASIAMHWWIVRREGVHVLAAVTSAVVILAFGPMFFIGPILFCGAFTPHIRCV